MSIHSRIHTIKDRDADTDRDIGADTNSYRCRCERVSACSWPCLETYACYLKCWYAPVYIYGSTAHNQLNV